jgi:hypothetical protein
VASKIYSRNPLGLKLTFYNKVNRKPYASIDVEDEALPLSSPNFKYAG